MQYMSKDVLLEMLGFIRHQSKFIIETTSDVKEVDELLVTTAGMVLYNSTCMCLQTVGETVKKINDMTDNGFFSVYYPQIPWRAIIGMHGDAQFAGSSSVPAHVEMMGFLGIGNNPMVGGTVACAVDVAQVLNK